MAYRNSLHADALKLVAKKLQSSLAVEGELPEDGLAAFGDDLMLALARKIVSGDEDDAETVEAVFAQARDAEASARSCWWTTAGGRLRSGLSRWSSIRIATSSAEPGRRPCCCRPPQPMECHSSVTIMSSPCDPHPTVHQADKGGPNGRGGSFKSVTITNCRNELSPLRLNRHPKSEVRNCRQFSQSDIRINQLPSLLCS